MALVPVEQFDSAVLSSLSKAVSGGQCSDLITALTSAMTSTDASKSNRSRSKSPRSMLDRHRRFRSSSRSRHRDKSLDYRPSRSRRRSKSPKDHPSRSRQRSKSPDDRASRSRRRSKTRRSKSRRYKKSRSRSRSPRRRSSSRSHKRQKKHKSHRRYSTGSSASLGREAATKYSILDTPPKKSLKGAEYRFSVNEGQTKFNDSAIAAIHGIAKSLPAKSTESLGLLEKLKEFIVERQEDVWVADAYGLNIAGAIDKSNDLPISKKKKKELNRALKSAGPAYAPRGATVSCRNFCQPQQPFLGQRGGQPRYANNNFQQRYGSFTTASDDPGCFLCHKTDHWACNCPSNGYRYGQGSYRNFRYQRARPSGIPRPLFAPKGA